MCYRWFKKFQSGDFELDNEPRGKPHQKFEDAELQAFLDDDSTQAQKKLAKQLQVSQGSVSGLLDQFPKRKPRPNRLGKKAMLCVWWDQTGVVYFKLLKPGETVNTSRYEQQMHSLREALNEKRPELREKHNKLILQHDNAPAHNATAVKNTIKDLGWELLPHPPYSPDLAPYAARNRQENGRHAYRLASDLWTSLIVQLTFPGVNPKPRKMEQGREENPKEPMESDPDSESGGSPTFPKKETTFGKTQEIAPGQEDVTPPPPVSDVLGRLTTTLHQLSAVTGHRERWNRYDGSYKAQSFFTNYDAQADRAQLQYSTRLKKPPDLLQAPLRITNTRAYVTCSPDHL
ncbi:hypothetical protein LAZ67_1000161 [Cordylochernes scorpioides]|uniref:Transposase n=1 Tax=Cordylochernes scorpioides TaxID=51811 RepID=A0ABY6JW07_9ARAC|nr:hypothetical protein LAZ67_1000161 [Cordylochernes scorpioides]